MSLVAELRRELANKEAEADALRRAVEVLEGRRAPEGETLKALSFEGLGIVDAAKRFIVETGGTPRATREIADALLSRGVATKSKNFVATVYSTLDNSKRFVRTADGNWQPKQSTGGSAD
jgi:hypothetical protein